MGKDPSPAIEEGGARAEASPISAVRKEEELEQAPRWGPGQWARTSERDEHLNHQPTQGGSAGASMAASPSLSGEEEIAEGPQSEMVTPFISSELCSLLFNRH